MSAYPLLTATDFVSLRHGQPLFPPVTYALYPGQVTLLTGANGVGKTSLLRSLCGLLTHEGSLSTEGTFLFLSTTILFLNPLTCHQWLGHQRLLCHKSQEPEESLEALLQAAGLGEKAHHLTTTLSQGQRKRLQLTKLLLHPQALWFLDEPTEGLDSQGRQWLLTLLKTHVSTQGAALIATHDPAFFAPLKGDLLCL